MIKKSASILRIASFVDKRTQTIPIVISLNCSRNKSCAREFKVGAFVQAFTKKNKRKSLAIPILALNSNREEATVVDSKERVVRKKIKTGVSKDKYIEVLSGLKEGERVIIFSNRYVANGEKVSEVKI